MERILCAAIEMQGFLTSDNRYVNRTGGYWIAKNAGQLLHDIHDASDPKLVSEDLYDSFSKRANAL